MAQHAEQPEKVASSATWQALERSLEARRQKIAAEISAYPAPIAGCDAQFNALLEERRQLTEKLRDLRDARNAPDADAEAFKKQTHLGLSI